MLGSMRAGLVFPNCAGRSGSRQDRSLASSVRDNNVDQALRALKKKMQREGIFREMKFRRNYEKPSESALARKPNPSAASARLTASEMQREGLLPTKPKPVPGVAAR